MYVKYGYVFDRDVFSFFQVFPYIRDSLEAHIFVLMFRYASDTGYIEENEELEDGTLEHVSGRNEESIAHPKVYKKNLSRLNILHMERPPYGRKEKEI